MRTLDEAIEHFTWDNYKEVSDSLLDINESNLDYEMLKQPGLYSYYHALMCYAKNQVSERERNVMQIEAGIRKGSKQGSTTKVTVKDIDAMVFSSEDYKQATQELDKANFKYELLKGLVRALEHKKDMIVQVSVNKREEIKLHNR